jgi:hypothetical protein
VGVCGGRGEAGSEGAGRGMKGTNWEQAIELDMTYRRRAHVAGARKGMLGLVASPEPERGLRSPCLAMRFAAGQGVELAGDGGDASWQRSSGGAIG